MRRAGVRRAGKKNPKTRPQFCFLPLNVVVRQGTLAASLQIRGEKDKGGESLDPCCCQVASKPKLNSTAPSPDFWSYTLVNYLPLKLGGSRFSVL